MSLIKSRLPTFNRQLKDERDYWEEQLARPPGRSNFRPDFERPATYSSSKGAVAVTFPEQLTRRLSKLTGNSPLLLNATLLAALKVCLYKHTGSRRIVVGSPPRRKGDEAEPAPNALALVDDIEAARPFSELLVAVRGTMLAAYARQALPYEQLVKHLKLDRVENRCPLFDVALKLRGFHGELPDVRNDITITVTHADGLLTAAVEFNRAMFQASSVESFARHWLTVLDSALENPGAPVNRLEMLTAAERRRVLGDWNPGAGGFEEEVLSEMFERQAARAGDAVALVYEDERLSYAQLDARANQLAHHLRSLGVGPEVPVGLYLERSLGMVVAVLAVLKAGGAYVPLDPAYPAERVSFMLKDAGVRVLLTCSSMEASLPATDIPVVRLDANSAEIGRHGTGRPPGGVLPENAAYVIYTSGSTGTPKGVVVTHGNVSRLMHATRAWFGFGPSDVWALFHSYAFDFSVWEMWGALLYGGRLVVVPYMVSREPESFSELLRRERVTVLNQTPSAFRQLVHLEAAAGGGNQHGARDESGLSLRLVIFGGEALDFQSLRPWFERYGDERPRLVNMYGITETTVHVTYHPLSADAARGARASVIGRPIPDLRLYILDRDMNPVPPGVTGEIYVGGAGLARGYLNRPGLTAQRFVPDPFGGEAGARLYRTGDAARYLPGGEIEYAGRLDEQVKVRGFRIELGEIEAALAEHPSVVKAVAAARPQPGGAAGDTRLVAYVVPDPDSIVNVSELQGHLRALLPDYMVPSALVVLDELPLTPSGKLDRRALPEPEMTREAAGREYEPPRGEVEEIIAGIWAAVLGVERVGAHDNFFELGGHSLLATQAVSRMNEVLGVSVSLRALFEQPTVRAVALAVEAVRGGEAGPAEEAAPPLLPREDDGPLPLSFAQQRLWFLDQLEPGSHLYNMPMTLRLTGELDLPALEGALSDISARHEVLRTTFGMNEGEPVQVVSPPAPVSIPVVDLTNLDSHAAAAEAARLRAQEATTGFDLRRGPLVRVRLLRLAPDEHLLLLTLHHIVSDGWSLGVLMREVGHFYTARQTGAPAALAPLPFQYADYARWQRQYLTGARLSRQLDYWRRQLGEAARRDEVLALPTDRPRPAVQTYRGAHHPFRLSADLSDGVRQLAQRCGATVFMTLLGALQAMLARYAGQEQVSVGTAIANRTRAETEDLIGFFVNTLVLRTDLSGDPTFEELLGRVREVCLGAYAHQDLPFERLVEELQPARSLSHTPLFQVMLMMQNVPLGELALPGVRLEVVEAEDVAAKFDLTLVVAESDESLAGVWEYNADLFDAETIARLAGHFETLLTSAAEDEGRRLGELGLLTEGERRQIVGGWNETAAEYAEAGLCLHELFERQARLTPEATALVCGEERVTYAELDGRADRLARRLRALGVGPEVLVGVMVERGVAMLAALFGVLKAGGAYVPLDPSYPARRLRQMVEGSGLRVLVAGGGGAAERAGLGGVTVLEVGAEEEEDAAAAVAGEEAREEAGVGPDNLAYVIFTSGSTGTPKGVMISHRNVVNFFAGMDGILGTDAPGTWLAVTSISFDISVLELFWTLARGFSVVIQQEQYELARTVGPSAEVLSRPIDFSLFYFASDDTGAADDGYELLLEGAKFADRHGFAAVWTPERHFHAFGGLYPNPSITSAALAVLTERIQIRAGSVVLPLHNPIRVAEEWAVVDKLSKGRAAISFASGWQADDFALAPENYARRKEVMLREIETVRRLWRGEAVAARGGAGNEVQVRIHPRPVRPELPIWLTAAANPETFQAAGEIGAGVLTHLVGQSLEELQTKIGLYREAWRRHGHGPGPGHVTLMLHTFVGADLDGVKKTVRPALLNYLKTSTDLLKNWALRVGQGELAEGLTEVDMEALMEQAFERYFETSGLLGTPGVCLRVVERLKRAGVDEVACLIDFGVPAGEVLASLPYLDAVREESNRGRDALPAAVDYSPAAQIRRHGVTHLQCTPSMARMLGTDPDSLDAIGSLRKLLLGGEALPVSLARQLRDNTRGDIYNMYGPTETTIWSATHRLERVGGAVPLGKPIVNTQIYILDGRLRPLPVGVPGELYIGGAGLARGYLNRPAASAERFIPDQFSAEPGARLYRTGDRARFLADGNVEFLGRVDRQVKIRGHRIELSEVEAAIGEHPGVRQAAVAARADDFEDQRLVAYVVGDEGAAPEGPRPARVAADASLRRADGQYLTLDNGMLVAHASAIHAHAAYHEIFEEEVYLRHGVALADGACVFDVGANIGMFTLFAHQLRRGLTVHAFEPIPSTFEVLRENVALYGVNATLHECGLAAAAGEDDFTFYPELPGLSGRYADVEETKRDARAFVLRNAAVPEQLKQSLSPREMEEVLAQRFRSETHRCRLRTLSDVMREHNVGRIDLLKIDVEKSEYDVLAGIEAEDWPKIKQIVMEVETDALLQQVTSLLTRHGYEYVVDKAPGTEAQNGGQSLRVYMLYAVRSADGYRLTQAAAEPAPRPNAAPESRLSPDGLRGFLRERLPEYSVPSAFVFLDELPLTPNGKVDYRALPAPRQERAEAGKDFAPPGTELELLIASVWREVLGREEVGVRDSFFDLGGHSLLVLRVRGKLQERLGHELPLISLFQYPTVESLARHLSRGQGVQPDFRGVRERAAQQKQALTRQRRQIRPRGKSDE